MVRTQQEQQVRLFYFQPLMAEQIYENIDILYGQLGHKINQFFLKNIVFHHCMFTGSYVWFFVKDTAESLVDFQVFSSVDTKVTVFDAFRLGRRINQFLLQVVDLQV